MLVGSQEILPVGSYGEKPGGLSLGRFDVHQCELPIRGDGKGGYTIVPAVGYVQEPAIGAQLDVGAGILPLKVSRQGTFFLDNGKARGGFLIG